MEVIFTQTRKTQMTLDDHDNKFNYITEGKKEEFGWKGQPLSWFFPHKDGSYGLQLQGTGTGTALEKSGQWKDCLAVFAFYQSMFVDKNNPED